MEKIIYIKKDHSKVVNSLLNLFPVNSVICFRGPMGSGKTTLIKDFIRQLGGIEQGSSPSFGIVNEYHYPDGELLGYHFDFYRLDDPMEALDLGLEEYYNRGVWIFIEWPEKIEELLPEERMELSLEIVDPVTRQLIIKKKNLL
jgi:tRNA threonylcarbamoyladenosine biosynthesis protein TsaE